MRLPISLLVPAFLSFTGVALGAFGAHALKEPLATRGTAAIWQTAVFYHLLHALAVLVVSLAARLGQVRGELKPGPLRSSALCWSAGVVLFSGSLYWLAFGGPRWLGPITPLGGLCFLAGWLMVGFAARKGKEESP